MRLSGLVVLAGAMLSTSLVAQSGATRPTAETSSLARTVLSKLRSVEQVRFTMQKLGPVFAESVLAQTAGTPTDPFASFAKTAAGKAHLKAMLAEEFSAAYAAHLPELTDVLVAHLATDLSEADLRAVSAFLETPAGAHWAAEMVVLQQQSSSAGAAIGARAGAEAVSTTLNRLATEGGGEK